MQNNSEYKMRIKVQRAEPKLANFPALSAIKFRQSESSAATKKKTAGNDENFLQLETAESSSCFATAADTHEGRQILTSKFIWVCLDV